jgi:hypothetical protein
LPPPPLRRWTWCSGQAAGGGARVAASPTARPTAAPGKRGRILIYHTHTNEAYRKAPGDTYQETEAWRTADQSHSVVRVGEVLVELLEDRGFDVIHEVTNHEPPDLGTAYERSLKTIEGYPKNFDLYIDLHRDAYTRGLQDNFGEGGRRGRGAADVSRGQRQGV